MTTEQLDRAFGETPEMFSDKVDLTLRNLEETKMKKWTVRTVLVACLIGILCISAAYALIAGGQEWYFTNRFTAYQTHEPEKQAGIIKHLQTPKTQSQTESELVQVSVNDFSCAPEGGCITMSLSILPVNADAQELHPFHNLDADGYYDGETRTEHYLMTDAGSGPVYAQMTDPNKTLVLFEQENEVSLNTPDGEMLKGEGMYDFYFAEDGTLICVMEIQVPADTLASWQGQAKTFCLHYRAVVYNGADDEMLNYGGETGYVTFQVEIE